MHFPTVLIHETVVSTVFEFDFIESTCCKLWNHTCMFPLFSLGLWKTLRGDGQSHQLSKIGGDMSPRPHLLTSKKHIETFHYSMYASSNKDHFECFITCPSNATIMLFVTQEIKVKIKVYSSKEKISVWFNFSVTKYYEIPANCFKNLWITFKICFNIEKHGITFVVGLA